MSFKTTLALGLSAAILLVVYHALGVIVAGLTVIFYYLLGVASLILIYIGVMIWRQKETERLRAVDGQYALQRGRLADGTPVLVDMNKSISGISILHRHNGPVEVPPAAGWQLQGEYVAKIQTTRSLAAITPGDAAMIKTHGAISQPRLPANITKLLGKDEKPTPTTATTDTTATRPALAAPRLTIEDALARSTGERWITGQADNGELIAFEPNRHAHAAIVGVTGTGKTTSVGFTLALEALRAGWHVVILDPDGGINWQPFSAVAEWHETNRTTFPTQIAAIYRLYERRATINNPRPVLIILEEYGDLIRQLRKANRAEADNVDGMIDAILQRGRKRRVHLALIDQYPEHWSQAVIGGTKFRTVFQLGPNQGSKMEEYRAAKLPDVGRFLTKGAEYSSFNAEAILPRLLAQLPAPSTRRVITDQAIGNNSADHSPAPSVAAYPTPTGVETPPNAPNEWSNERATERPPLTQDEARQAIFAHLEKTPTATQADIRSALKTSNGWTHQCWHEWHNARKTAPPRPRVEPVETVPDALHGWREIVESDNPASIEQMETIRHAIATGKIKVG